MARSRRKKQAGTKRKGKPTRVSDAAFVEEFCLILKDGCYATTACRLTGVPEGTYDGWMVRADKELDRCFGGEEELEVDETEAPYVAFRLATLKAAAEAERETVKSLRKAGLGGIKGEWRAAEAWLRRRFRHWSDAAQVAEATSTTVIVQTGIPGVDDE